MALPTGFGYLPGLYRQLHSRKLEFKKPGTRAQGNLLVELAEEILFELMTYLFYQNVNPD